MTGVATLALYVVAFAAALAGFTALALALDRHHEDSFGRELTVRRTRVFLRAAGAAGLALSLGASLFIQGRSQGWVLWAGVSTAAALAVVLLLTYLPRASRYFGLCSGGAALASVVLILITGIVQWA